ncbi:efflux transporter outer membrane subunit [Ferrovum sp. PN-J185]|uniref:efflux transporter outer membrane subunit n=1 Tax=Ferrovum sp. PN-J185 TaxID=1356306 RepID=UPI001E389D27|nr:efflux transporter outer membrane subunit [Ferrovum sp. PN-J185]MCC6068960.1 efflux transporter outer membrane subunit [Ferrovum sp. PN-J185]MDE1891060.1 efflux transporter outer membrane subunit [Betaproteobacteria bacterium]MDE2055628.1 efflux transporter outer membrane subunit [Betaproteobacteria bacterium]
MNFFIAKVRHLTIIFSLFILGCASNQGIVPSTQPLSINQINVGHTLSTPVTTTWPQHNWWNIYKDPQLNQLIAEAIQDSQIIKSINHRLALARGVTELYQSQRQPNVDINSTAMREHFTELQFIPPPWGGYTYWNNNIFASLSYNLDLWGQRKDQWLASVDEAQAVELDGQEIRIELENAIIKLYIELAATYQLTDIAQQQLDDSQERITLEKQRQQAGISTTASVNLHESSLPLLRAKITTLEQHSQLLKYEISALMGKGPGESQRIQRPHLTLNSAIGLPQDLPLHLIAKRPDIRAARSRINSMEKKIHVAQAAFYPDVNLSTFLGFEAIGFNQLLSHQGLMTGIGPAVSLPIFDGGMRRANLSIATTEYDLSVDQYNNRIINALKEVANAITTLKSTIQQQQDIDEALNKSHTSVLYANESYQAGLTDYQSVLTHNETYLNTKESLINIEKERLDAYAELMRALGGGI